jgi:uncharacterized repeat protein (TIGR01451 family)
MKAMITILLSIVLVFQCLCQTNTTICTEEVNQNGFFLRKCAILPENDFGGAENSVKSGVSFQYLIWFTLPEGADGVVITDVVPSELEILNTIPTANIDPATNKVIYNVPAGTASNTAQSLAINVRFPPGITCSGTIVSNKAEISADQLDPPLITDEIDVEAFAVNPFAILKSSTLPFNEQTNKYEGVVGQPVTYHLNIYKPSGYYYNNIGQQDLSEIFIYDIIPNDALLQGNVTCNNQTINYDLDNGLLQIDCSQFTLLGSALTPSLFCTMEILYPAVSFPINSIVNNEVYYTGNSCGEIDPVYSNTIQVQFGASSPGITTTKSVTIVNPVSGCVGNYWIYVSNTGNVFLDSYTIEDAIPADVEITMIKLFRSTLNQTVPITFTIEGEDPVVFDEVQNHTILFPNDVNNSFPAGSAFSIKRGDEDHPVEMGLYCRYQIEFRVNDDPVLEAGHAITNTASLTYSYGNQSSEPTLSEATFEIEEFQPRVCLYKTVCNPENSYMYGDIIRYRFTIQNNGSDLLDGAIIEDMLDPGLEYQGNELYYYSETLNPPCSENGNIPLQTNQWTGITTDHNLNNLKWEAIEIEPYCEVTNVWTSDGCDPEGINYYFIEFDVKVRQDAPAGTISNYYTMNGGGLVSDAQSEVAYILINNVFGANVEKFASKDNGLSWHKTLDIDQNDEVMFRLQFTNNSNYPVTDIILMDLLPMNYSSSDDRMILDRDSNRGSQFGLSYNDTDIPQLSTNPENLNFSLPAVSIDNSDNICTEELLYSPVGCNQPDWSGVSGKNVKFDFGGENVLPPGATLNCDFIVQTPEDLQSGLTVCNSFAVRSNGFFTIGDETVTVDNIAAESDIICLNYLYETGNDLPCEDPVFSWATQAGGTKNGTDSAWINAIVTDANKNVYTTGGYKGTVEFPNGQIFSLPFGESRILVAKQDEGGAFLWVTELGDLGFNEGRSIAVSPTGEVYITGIKSFLYYFTQEIIQEAFVAKMNGANGELMLDLVTDFSYWPSAGNDIAIGQDEKVYITGYECTWLKNNTPPKTSYCGWDDVLIRVFDHNLILISNQYLNIGGNGVDAGNGIATDQEGNIYIIGFFEQTVNFNPDWQGNTVFKTAIGGRDIFLLKLNQNTGFEWVATIGGDEDDIGSDIVIDDIGNIFITGWVSKSSVNLEGFNILHNPVGLSDGFVSRWTSGGNCDWTKFMETENEISFSKGFSIDLGPNEEKVFTTGIFSGMVKFNPDNSSPLTAQFEDMFILKRSADDGSFLSNLINTGLADNGILPGIHSIAVDENGCIYTTGNFIHADFDPLNTYPLQSAGEKDLFVQKLCCCCPGEEDFLDRIAKGFQITIDPVNCRVTVTLDQFNTCHFMAYHTPDWGDGSTFQPMLSPANGSWSHDYDQSGTYEICATLYEIDENGEFCYSGEICDTIEIICISWECEDFTVCCDDPIVWLSENAPDGAIFTGDFVTEMDGEFYFNPNCDNFPPPTPPYPGLYKEYEIAYSYYDAGGNAYNCYFTITVDADTPPSPDCPSLDIIVCLDSEPFWHGIIFIDPAELGVGTHYLDCFWTNACGSWGWDWITNPPALQVRRKVTVLALNANGYSIPDVTVCKSDPPFWHWGQWINPGGYEYGSANMIPYPIGYTDPCGTAVSGYYTVYVRSWDFICDTYKPDIPEEWFIVSSYVNPFPPYPSPDPTPIIDIFAPEIYLGHFEVGLGKSGILWPSGSINTIGNWDVYQAYKVKMNAPGWIELTGAIPEDKTINLDAGANYIPVLSQDYYPAMDIFTQLGNDLIFAFDLGSELLYWPQGGIVSLEVLEPGKGYLVGMTQPGQAAYDPLKGGVKNHTAAKPKVYDDAPWQLAKSGETHFISIATEALKALEPGDFIGVFNSEGVCSGLTKFESAPANLLLVAYGNDFTEKATTGLADNETMRFRIFHTASQTESEISATFDLSMPNTGNYATNGLSKITGIKTGATSLAENQASFIRIYPNPSNDIFNITGYDGKVNLTVLDLFGKEVFSKTVNLPAEVDLSKQPKGIYLISIKTDQHTLFEKLIYY